MLLVPRATNEEEGVGRLFLGLELALSSSLIMLLPRFDLLNSFLLSTHSLLTL